LTNRDKKLSGPVRRPPDSRTWATACANHPTPNNTSTMDTPVRRAAARRVARFDATTDTPSRFSPSARTSAASTTGVSPLTVTVITV
jgi:uncharacterized protein (DUF2126 family)